MAATAPATATVGGAAAGLAGGASTPLRGRGALPLLAAAAECWLALERADAVAGADIVDEGLLGGAATVFFCVAVVVAVVAALLTVPAFSFGSGAGSGARACGAALPAEESCCWATGWVTGAPSSLEAAAALRLAEPTVGAAPAGSANTSLAFAFGAGALSTLFSAVPAAAGSG